MLQLALPYLLLAVGGLCRPQPGWDQAVRLRHLYAARPGLHLQISEDGQIHGSAEQTQHSLLEIRPIEPGHVVLKGVATARFLCMESDGKLYSSPVYSRADCTFRETIQPDGYNIYVSEGHGVLLSLGAQQQRQQDRGLPALARFLPMISTLSPPRLPVAPSEEQVDEMDSFGKLSQIIHSPSFHRR